MGDEVRMAIPETMLASGYDAPGGPEVLRLERTVVPQPGEGEVLIEVAYAGVNRPDVIQRKGHYPPPPGASPIPGLEVAGTIVSTGADVADGMVGQQVCALVTGGGYAQYALARYAHCLPVPETLSLAEAAAMPETLFTVWHNVFQRGWASHGETILVHGGTSGIGTMAIKLGKLFDMTVIVTCGSEDKCHAARDIGADHAINYRTQDFVERVKQITDGGGVELVLDMVSGEYVPPQSRLSGRRRAPRDDRGAGRDQSGTQHGANHGAAAHADRIDPARAARCVQGATVRRNR